MLPKVVYWMLIILLLTAATLAQAQQSIKVPRVGYLTAGGDPNARGPEVEVFAQGLRNLGYVEGKNIMIEYRGAEGKQGRIPELVAELVRLKVDAFVSTSLPAIRAAMQATNSIPIVIVTTADPVEAGLVESLARPGGNVTGLTRFTRELSGKRLELFKEAVPSISRIAVLAEAGREGSVSALAEYEVAARALKLALQSIEIQSPNPDLDAAFRTAVTRRVDALLPVFGPVTGRFSKRIAVLAIKNRLPSMCERSDFVDAGGMISYTANDSENFRRAAVFVDKILKGAKPADLPVEQPTRFEFVINLNTAKQISVTIPPNVLARADRVIR